MEEEFFDIVIRSQNQESQKAELPGKQRQLNRISLIDETNKAALRALLEKQQARKKADDEEQAACIYIKEKKDVNSEELFWATAITVLGSYDGSLDFLGDIPNLEHLTCYHILPKDVLEQIDLSSMEELDLTVDDENEDVYIDAPWLKKLSLGGAINRPSPLERMLLDSSRLDISRCKRLEALNLRNYDSYDISSIGLLKRLKSLRLSQMKFEDLEWLKDCNNLETLVFENCEFLLESLPALPHLKSLSIYLGGLDSIKGLPAFPELEVLNLSHNNITDVSELLKIKTLKKLDLYHNPIRNPKAVRGLGIEDTVITENDRRQRKIANDFQFLLYRAFLRLKKNETDLKEGNISNPYLRRRLEADSKKSEEERYSEYINLDVENAIERMRSYVNTPDEDSTEENLKEIYVTYIKQNYPYVRIPEGVYAQIEREKAGIGAFYRAKPGFIFFVRDGVFAIEISLRRDQKEHIRIVEWEGETEFYRSELARMLNKVFEVPADEHVRIRIMDLYGASGGDGLEVGILAAYASLKCNYVVPADTFITGKSVRKNAFKSETPYRFIIDEARRQGCRHLAVFSTAKTSDYNPEGIEIEFYKKIDDFFKEREAIEVEEAQLEIEGLGAFPNKQTQ